MICISYKKLAEDVNPGSVILCSDDTITVLYCDKELGLVRFRCENSVVLGWGVPNKIDMIALSFVCKGSDLVEVRKLLGKHAKTILLMSKRTSSIMGIFSKVETAPMPMGPLESLASSAVRSAFSSPHLGPNKRQNHREASVKVQA
ncbi:hypothetical protein Ddye_010634 [Dipteronia dyeriana]|uniref:pyruvate kinase n=1 Tax=Dipteronia dyeriana TaxID=168575 RepID=A0AAE0CNF8_9ROSI|nr:hypothetical protein Ddye_010634 [Dipteronia dyeriana]